MPNGNFLHQKTNRYNTLYFYNGNSSDIEGEEISVKHLVKVMYSPNTILFIIEI